MDSFNEIRGYEMTRERLMRLLLYVIAAIIIRILINRKKKVSKRKWEQANRKNKRSYLENYCIQNDYSTYWLLTYSLVCSVTMLYYYFVLYKQDVLILKGFVAVFLCLLCLVLICRVWKVTVKGEDIIFRNSFGITKRYRFDDITCVVIRGEILTIYSGNKKLFYFDENTDYYYFDMQLAQKGIPKKSWAAFKRMRLVDFEEAHKFSSNHKEILKNDNTCGCFYCLKIFNPNEITEWIDTYGTAICPYCGIDSLIGESSGYPINKKFLKKMNKYWFK